MGGRRHKTEIHAPSYSLSRLKCAYSGSFGVKDTTFVLDFVNNGADILAAFKTYYQTATLEYVTNPNLVFDIRSKLDATGYYDKFEVDRVAGIELNPKARQSELQAAIFSVADRLLRRFEFPDIVQAPHPLARV